jgi:hypothetical protein
MDKTWLQFGKFETPKIKKGLDDLRLVKTSTFKPLLEYVVMLYMSGKWGFIT